MRISAYCRVSTDSEQQEKSFEAQQSYFSREIEARGHELYKVYGDEGETGTKLNNRKEFNQMLYDAGIDIIESFRSDAKRNQHGNIDNRLKKKHINYEESDRAPLFNEIWIKNTSRFARNTLSFQIVEILRSKGVHIYFIEQNINTKEISADFLLKLFQLFDEQESRDKSSKVMFGLKERAKTKQTISTTKNIYGYRYIKDTNSLEIIENEASVIRFIFKLYLDGYGTRRIINQLSKENMYTRNKKPFCPSTIKRILSNEKYCGTNVRNKYSYGRVFNKHSYAHINDKSNWIIHEDHDRIPPIIDKETFELAQEKFKNSVQHISQKGIYKGISEYAGLLYCENCGGVYYSNVDKGRRYYNCSTKKHKGSHLCNNPNISIQKLENQLTKESVYSSHCTHIVIYRTKMTELLQMLKKQISIDDKEKSMRLQSEIDDLSIKKDKYVEMYANSFISDSELKIKIEPIIKRMEELKFSLSISSKHNNELENDIADISEAIEYMNDEIRQITEDFNENKGRYQGKKYLKEIEKIIVEKDGTLDVNCKINSIVIELSEKYKKLYNEMKYSIAG